MENPINIMNEDYSCNILEELNRLRKSKLFCDVVLKIQDQTFSAHRNVLVSASKYFANMLKGKHNQIETYNIKEWNPDAFKILLGYIYSGVISMNGENAGEVLKLADILELKWPKNVCNKFLVNSLTQSCSPREENLEISSRKRRHLADIVSDSKKSNNLSDSDDKMCKFNPTHFPHRLIGLMYQLDLSVLCLLRKITYENKYPSFSISFENSDLGKFNSILYYNKKSIHVQIENVDQYYIDNRITYAKLFNKEKRGFSIHNYFDRFVKYLISESDSSLNNIEYLIIYTNTGLDLTYNKKLKQVRSNNFYPFQFNKINIEEFEILKDFFFTNDNTEDRGFFQFAKDKLTREELLKRLEFPSDIQDERIISQKFKKEIKENFLNKLIFAINQPNREELNSIIKNEIEENYGGKYDYTALEQEVLGTLTGQEGQKRLGKPFNHIPRIIYEFNLLMHCLHNMFLHTNISSICFKRKNHISNDITLHFENEIIYIKACTASSNIDYGQLFSSWHHEWNKSFSVNKLFSLFIEELEKDLKYFIIYTNVDLGLTEENTLKQSRSKDFYPLKFTIINIRKKKYKILRGSCLNENSLYQFSREDTTREKLLSLLKLPPYLQKKKEEGTFLNENEIELKQKFLDKLIFAVIQPNNEELDIIIKNEIENSNKVPYNYEELHEIALRWSESHEFGPIQKGIMIKLYEDIKNKRLSYQKIYENHKEEIKFAKGMFSRSGSTAFNQFLEFLIRGKGKKSLEVLKRGDVNRASMSSILGRVGRNASTAFQDLHDLWFDEKGNKTHYLRNLEENGINLSTMSSILNRAGTNAAKTFKDLYNLWFDKEGNITQYLKTLKENDIDLNNISSILHTAGANAPEAFKDLYDLWFDEDGSKTQYLITLEENGINLTNISRLLGGAGANAAKAFQDLYDLWFDEERNKTQYLITLEEKGINLVNISRLLGGAGANAAKAFQDLFDLWFDEQKNKTPYLKSLEETGISLSNMSSILHGAGAKTPKAFKDLFDLWFDDKGNETKYLKILKEKEINLYTMSNILQAAGANSSKAFKDLFDLWFDEEGNKTKYLRTLKEKEIKLTIISNLLGGAGFNSAKAFKELYDLWFDEIGNKTQYLKSLEGNEISLSNVSTILYGAGPNAPKAFKDLYDVWFDEIGNKTQYFKFFEEKGINFTKLSSILSGTGVNAAKTFKDLYNLYFDEEKNIKSI